MKSMPWSKTRRFLVFTIAILIVCCGMASAALADEAAIGLSDPQPATDTAATPETADTSTAADDWGAQPTGDTTATEPAPVYADPAPAAPAPAAQPEPAMYAGPEVAPVQPVPAAPPLGQKRAGFALELSFGISKPILALEEELMDFNSLQGGLFLGGKINRVIVGMGFKLNRFTYRSKSDFGSSSSSYSYALSSSDSDYYSSGSSSDENKESVTQLLFKPGIRFVMVRSDDEKVEMFGAINIGAGTMFFREDGESDDDDKYFLLEYDGGLGVRYWAHPQFGVSATGGVSGNFFRVKDSESDSSYSYHVISIVGGLQLLGVF